MTPEVSHAASLVKDRLALLPGPALDELITAAERAERVEDLPPWAVGVLAAIAAEPAAPVDGLGEVDRSGLSPDEAGWVDVGERQLGDPDSVMITPPPGPAAVWDGWPDD